MREVFADLAWYRGSLYATNQLARTTAAAEYEVSYQLSRWDGRFWATVDSGLADMASVLYAHPAGPYIGGAFGRIGARPAAGAVSYASLVPAGERGNRP